MKKSILILGLTLVLALIVGVNAQAQPKKVNESVTTYYYSPAKILPLGEGRLYMTYEAIGVTVSDTSEGLFHNASGRALGGMTFEKNLYNDERGQGVWNLQNGDKVFYKYTFAGEHKPGGIGIAKGIVTILGGTGKCVGITGRFEATRYVVRSSIEGVGQSYTKATIKYTLP